MGLIVDWEEYQQRFTEADLIPPKDHLPLHDTMMVYDETGGQVGYATSFMYSPILQEHIALARIRPDLAVPDTRVNLEFTVNHHYRKIGARVVRMPFFSPARKTAAQSTSGDQS